MSVKHFCDHCGDALGVHNEVPVTAARACFTSEPKKGLMFSVTTGLDGTWNAGDFCKYCIIDAICNADDRPRPAEG